jgi:hypothetical protein
MDIQKLAQAIFDMLCDRGVIDTGLFPLKADVDMEIEEDVVNAIGDLIEELG